MSTAKWASIPQKEFEDVVKNSKSLMEVARKLGYKVGGGGVYKVIRQGIEFYNLDVSHFTGSGWKRYQYNYDWMKKGIKYRSNYAAGLISLRGHKCEICGNTHWMDKPIPLEVHHKDQDKTNNESENILLLCPNCHYFTDGYRGRK